MTKEFRYGELGGRYQENGKGEVIVKQILGSKLGRKSYEREEGWISKIKEWNM